MPKALITTRFPSTAVVARKLGLEESRIGRVVELMNLSSDKTAHVMLTRERKQTPKQSRSKSAKPRRRIRQKR